MSALRRFELFVQRVVESPFSRLTGTRLQPVQLARRLEQELDANKTIGVGRVYVPNVFTIALGPRDYEGVEQFRTALQTELQVYVASQASERGYSFVGPVEVGVERDPDVGAGTMRVVSALRESPAVAAGRPTALAHTADLGAALPGGPVAPIQSGPPAVARLDVREEGGELRSVYVVGPTIRLGRGLDNDVVLDSLSVSRYHAQVAVEAPGRFTVRDLDSTNGTLLNGAPVTQQVLSYGDTITLGAVEVHVVRPS